MTEALGEKPPFPKIINLGESGNQAHYRKALLEAADKLERDNHGYDTVALIHCGRGACNIVAEVIRELRISAGEEK